MGLKQNQEKMNNQEQKEKSKKRYITLLLLIAGFLIGVTKGEMLIWKIIFTLIALGLTIFVNKKLLR